MKYVNVKSTRLAEKSGQNKVRANTRLRTLFSIGIALTLVFIFVTRYGDRLKDIFDPVSIVASVAASDLKETDGRTNVLIMGSDKRPNGNGSVYSMLTDTIMVVSVGRVDQNVVIISIPRDLWIGDPYYSKINAIYYAPLFGVDYTNEKTNPDDLKKIVEETLGLPIHYYAVVDFKIFKDSIDAIGGVDVNVETGFDDFQYPIEGKENAPENERYQSIHFEEGINHMDGDTALKFVRSRHGNNNEGTDFSRSKRQQKLLLAVKDKALSLETLFNPIKLKELYDAYASNVETDIDLGTIQGFYLLTKQTNFDDIKSIVLDDRSASSEGGLLYAPEDTSLYGGAYVLIPRAGDFSQIHAYVQKFIFEQ
ncbi:hypothetical protein A3F07_00120 [candidate division WWE3 bacterium RIFCSPHIGHO2_12_FULL_38_15]|uniref:Cell envelope-related transcriptional attenuator domain-containing protein n=1 Tax=candidate division WWE3 bacterium RIFCSPHIGHO2_02_FULL_38_14 TaxID=1802620 RepID=A0A1F4V6P4_UNCKA|nr:MAG: hypothetical protein A2793_01080 [candidate division WWE3 bacterium RIFCSPHIGHO2_01_FULL_38_45]OGC49244.1 MAG: hypothetical protein A3F07_00120 [candidate division WWE3 bacterium RIFCSPHIGHO2_12_FULL_38_15]OGC52837.1 MAG: hypothetical protein A3D91_00435 [candidate division WWE3 bacterium RIFCSPHIGHO2_02_FULL_38_14]OGC54139.1 MAG: hypothetical protein A3B64_00385 [candidate division WWE3 bacterium RIFCSPLOWO2_01_FULL_37_24]HLB51334.1 LCP family protein [Patescibacteria group bacterium]